jgi:hypothetical protein
VLTERGRRLLAGMELADSVTLDPHKWLYQPFECGCLLVRSGRRLREAFRIQPDYLKDLQTGELEVNFSDLGVQLSRMSRALKLWLSLRYFGVEAFRAASGHGLISSTRLRGRFALRMCVLNHTSGPGDVERVLEWLERAPAPAAPPGTTALTAAYDRDPPITRSWSNHRLGALDTGGLRRVPLFGSLTDAELERVADLAGET